MVEYNKSQYQKDVTGMRFQYFIGYIDSGYNMLEAERFTNYSMNKQLEGMVDNIKEVSKFGERRR